MANSRRKCCRCGRHRPIAELNVTGIQARCLEQCMPLVKPAPKPRRRLAPRQARKAGLAGRSAKTVKVYEERRRLVARTLEHRPWCELQVAGVCTGRSQAVHEPKTRARGGSILDPANTVATCARCHDWLHTHVTEATERGWLVSQFAPRED